MTPEQRLDALNLEIKAMMVRRRRSQTEFAKALGIAQAQLSLRLCGKITWRITELWQVADLLGCTVLDLLASADADNLAVVPA